MAARARELPLIGPTLILLAGGRSTRMGRPKHELPVGETTLLSWQVERLGRFFSDVIVVGAPAPRGTRSVPDRRRDAGPLAGIEAGLLAMTWDDRPAFVLACDMPRARASLGALLIRRCAGHDAAVPRTSRLAQPTCAAYARTALPRISAYLDAGHRRVTMALDALDVRYLDDVELRAEDVSLDELDDLDTPADYEAFIASLRP